MPTQVITSTSRLDVFLAERLLRTIMLGLSIADDDESDVDDFLGRLRVRGVRYDRFWLHWEV